MELNIVWCPMSQRVGTVEVEDQIINLLTKNKEKVFSFRCREFLSRKIKSQKFII